MSRNVAPGVVRLSHIVFTTRVCCGERSLLRPPNRPRALADDNPIIVRSRISSFSNCVKAAKKWKTSLPAAVLVSNFSLREMK